MNQAERYAFQQTIIGKKTNLVAEQLRMAYTKQFNIPKSYIKTGKITVLRDEQTNQIIKYIEE